MKKIVLLLCFIWIKSPIYAQSTPEDISKHFFDLYKTKNSDAALDYLFSTNKFSINSKENIDDLKSALKKSIEYSGNYWGFDFISKKSAGPNLFLLTFIAKHESQPLTFRILFYKPGSQWQVQNFKFDNKIDEELEELSKRHLFENLLIN